MARLPARSPLHLAALALLLAGALTAHAGYLVQDPGSEFEINHAGDDSVDIVNDITVRAGGLLDVNNTGAGTIAVTASAVITVDGAASQADFAMGAADPLALAGRISLRAGGQLIVSSGIDVASGGTLGGIGQVNADVSNAGTLALGNVNGATTTGTLTVDGDLTQLPGGVITVNVGGPLPDDADRLIVTGDLTAAGTVILTLVNDYAPPPGTTVEVIEAAGSFTGTLTGTITNPPPGISESFTVDEDGVATLAAAPAIVPAVPPAVAILLGLVLLAAGRRSLVEHVRRPN